MALSRVPSMHEAPGLISSIMLSQAMQCPWFPRLDVEKFKVIPDKVKQQESSCQKEKRKKNYETPTTKTFVQMQMSPQR